MQLIADLHLHSKYSRAVSQKMDILEIAHWARRKGIDIVATGDWTHPLWLREIKANLEEDGSGLLKLKTRFSTPRFSGEKTSDAVASSSKLKTKEPLFLLSTEISSIYAQGGKQRRIHNLIFAPSIFVVEKINKKLEKRGANLFSDGRPIIGFTSEQLVELVLGVDKDCLVVPCHVWTPWFSLYGSMSGFDSIEECFGNMSKYIYAIETGLSSDPAMNWRIKELDSRAILSFSDAHSGPKLGREATVFEIRNSKFEIRNEESKFKITYQDIAEAIKQSDKGNLAIAFTIEFYPEEGKYHYTGHRLCGVRQSPEETRKLGKTCPVCGRPLTVGVIHRVEQLAQRRLKPEGFKMKTDENGVRWISYEKRPPYVTLVPLLEILSESLGGLPTSQNIINEYENLTSRFGREFEVLLKTPFDKITKVAGEKVAEGIKKVRGGEIVVEPGFDGVFGKVKIWVEEEKEEKEKKQLSLF